MWVVTIPNVTHKMSSLLFCKLHEIIHNKYRACRIFLIGFNTFEACYCFGLFIRHTVFINRDGPAC